MPRVSIENVTATATHIEEFLETELVHGEKSRTLEVLTIPVSADLC